MSCQILNYTFRNVSIMQIYVLLHFKIRKLVLMFMKIKGKKKLEESLRWSLGMDTASLPSFLPSLSPFFLSSFFAKLWLRVHGWFAGSIWYSQRKMLHVMDHQPRPTLQLREPCSMLCGSLDGRGFGGEGIHVCIWLSPFTVHLKLSQHC